MNFSRLIQQAHGLTYTTSFLERVYTLYPELTDFDEQTGERGLFKEVLDNLWALLPPHLRTPLCVGSLLLRAMLNPNDAGSVVLHAYKEYVK